MLSDRVHRVLYTVPPSCCPSLPSISTPCCAIPPTTGLSLNAATGSWEFQCRCGPLKVQKRCAVSKNTEFQCRCGPLKVQNRLSILTTTYDFRLKLIWENATYTGTRRSTERRVPVRSAAGKPCSRIAPCIRFGAFWHFGCVWVRLGAFWCFLALWVRLGAFWCFLALWVRLGAFGCFLVLDEVHDLKVTSLCRTPIIVHKF